MALLQELSKGDEPIETGTAVEKAIGHFPQLTSAELKRRTPSGTLFWPGRFRFDLDHLKKQGYAANPSRGFWEITNLGIQRLNGSKPSSSA
jgi:restriction endonuclease Mrr